MQVLFNKLDDLSPPVAVVDPKKRTAGPVPALLGKLVYKHVRIFHGIPAPRVVIVRRRHTLHAGQRGSVATLVRGRRVRFPRPVLYFTKR